MVAVAASLDRPHSKRTVEEKHTHAAVTEALATWLVTKQLTAAVELSRDVRDALSAASPLFAETVASIEASAEDSVDMFE